eukprot:TRINITY_DN22337_c0_g1_i1.p1 TRINITY_DN22337_c0_g1~~TRINITY_DN22337_c0_g1_i1.p1  ORF type:complete len:817 (+),score=114.19 TRINITY_DN22337_c0_g1_i1:126-2576(+)
MPPEDDSLIREITKLQGGQVRIKQSQLSGLIKGFNHVDAPKLTGVVLGTNRPGLDFVLTNPSAQLLSRMLLACGSSGRLKLEFDRNSCSVGNNEVETQFPTCFLRPHSVQSEPPVDVQWIPYSSSFAKHTAGVEPSLPLRHAVFSDAPGFEESFSSQISGLTVISDPDFGEGEDFVIYEMADPSRPRSPEDTLMVDTELDESDEEATIGMFVNGFSGSEGLADADDVSGNLVSALPPASPPSKATQEGDVVEEAAAVPKEDEYSADGEADGSDDEASKRTEVEPEPRPQPTPKRRGRPRKSPVLVQEEDKSMPEVKPGKETRRSRKTPEVKSTSEQPHPAAPEAAAPDSDDASSDESMGTDDKLYIVERIVDARIATAADIKNLKKNRIYVKKGSSMYLIKWKGYPHSANSWEPEIMILDKTVIRDFQAKQSKTQTDKSEPPRKKAKSSKGEVSSVSPLVTSRTGSAASTTPDAAQRSPTVGRNGLRGRSPRGQPTPAAVGSGSSSMGHHLFSEPLKQFFWFANERHSIYHRRFVQKLPREEWTTDEVLKSHKFLNVYRELDRGTLYFREQMQKLGHQELDAVLVRTACYRLINRIQTFEEFRNHLEVVTQDKIDDSTFCTIPGIEGLEKFQLFMRNRRRIDLLTFTDAHPVLAFGQFEEALQCIVDKRAGLANEICDASMQTCFETLKSAVPHLGHLFSWQITCDLNELGVLNDDENQFVPVSREAKTSLNIIFDENIATDEDFVERAKSLQRMQQEMWSKLSLKFPSWKKGDLTLKAIERTLGEFCKYRRYVYERRYRGSWRPHGSTQPLVALA